MPIAMEPASWCANEGSPIFALQTCWKRHPPMSFLSFLAIGCLVLPPLPPIPYLYASCPSHLVSKCKLGQCSNPGQPIYYGWRITWWLQVTEGNSRAEHYAFPALSDLCSSVRILTHCDGTVLPPSVVRFTPIMFASSLGKSRPS